jgi:hypothetical protein
MRGANGVKSKWRDTALLFGALAFVALGVLMFIFGDVEDRSTATGVVVFFGACAVIGALELAPKPGLKPDKSGAVDIGPNRARMFIFALCSLGFAFAGWLMLNDAAYRDRIAGIVGGWLALIFFGLGGLVLLWRGATLKPLYRFNANGVQLLGKKPWAVKWADINGLRVRADDDFWDIELSLRSDIAVPPQHRSPTINENCIALGVAGTDASLEDVEHTLRSFLAKYGRDSFRTGRHQGR